MIAHRAKVGVSMTMRYATPVEANLGSLLGPNALGSLNMGQSHELGESYPGMTSLKNCLTSGFNTSGCITRVVTTSANHSRSFFRA